MDVVVLVWLLVSLCVPSVMACPTDHCECRANDPRTGFEVFCQNLTSSSIRDILAMIPNTTKVLELHGDVGSVEEGFFANAGFRYSLQRLTVSDAKLTQITASSLRGLDNLEELDLASNSITKLNSSLCRYVPALSTLSLRGGKLTTIVDSPFERCQRLKTLDLSNNNLLSLRNDTFIGLSTLNALFLSGNQLRYIAVHAFESLKNLSEISLAGNLDLGNSGDLQTGLITQIENIRILNLQKTSREGYEDTSLFIHLTSLETLILAENNISNLGFIRNASAIRDTVNVLDLKHNNLRLLGVKDLGKWNSLKELYLSWCNIHRIEVGSFSKLTMLQKLLLDGNPLVTISSTVFEGLTDLQQLNLSNCELLSIGNRAFHTLRSLDHLILNNNHLTTLSSNVFADMQGPLTSGIDTKNNPWVCDCRMFELKQLVVKGSLPLHINCSSPSNVSSTPLSSIQDFEFVGCNPPIFQGPEKESLFFMEGEDAIFQFMVMGMPPPQVIYQITDGNPLPENRTFHFKYGGMYTLTVTDIQANDSGNITLVASNFLGNASKILEIRVGTRDCPLLGDSCSCEEDESRNFTVNCMLSEATFDDVIRNLPNATKKLIISGDVRTVPTAFLSSYSLLRSLALRDANISDIEGGAFMGLTSLEDLSITGNHIKIVPDFLCERERLRNMKRITLNSNRISYLGNMSFTGCRNLFYLDLSSNEINDFETLNIDNLHILNLTNNKLNQISQEMFHGLPSLEQLDLRNNPDLFIEEKVRSPFQELKSLRYLLLGNTSTVRTRYSIPRDLFKGLSSLETLDLSNSKITDLEPGLFEGLERLKQLKLEGNPLRHLTNNAFAGLHRLERLLLRMCSIESIDNGAFHGLINLDDLNLYGNHLQTCQPEVFSTLPFDKIHFNVALNPFNCDCRLYELQSWIRRGRVQMNPVCAEPKPLQGASLLDIADADFQGCIAPSTCCGAALEIREGDDMVIHCEASGLPTPRLHYVVLNGDPLPDDKTNKTKNGTIHVYNMRRNNAGEFLCFATNIVGNSSSYYNVTVMSQAGPTASALPPDETPSGQWFVYVILAVVLAFIIGSGFVVFCYGYCKRRRRRDGILLEDMNTITEEE